MMIMQKPLFRRRWFKRLPCHVQEHYFIQGMKTMVSVHRPLKLYSHDTAPVSSRYESEIKDGLESLCTVCFFSCLQLYDFTFPFLTFNQRK